MIDYVTLQTGASGKMVMVEPELKPGLVRRVFYRLASGALEWAAYDDWSQHGERARFYGYASKELPNSMTEG